MQAGLPGTGIGGLFYFGLTLFMPLRELYRTLRGKSSLKAWKFIAVQYSFVLAISAGMWGEAWAIGKLMGWLATLNETTRQMMSQANTLSYVIPEVAILLLVGIIVLFFVVRFIVNRTARSRRQAAPPAAAALRREAA